MERRVINPWTWQEAQGYVQANEVTGAQRTLYCAGQVSVDENGETLHAGDMAAQLQQVVANVETILTQAGMKLSDIVRSNIYTTDTDLFFQHAQAGLGRLIAEGCQPAATLLGITRLGSPDLMVEIEVTAVA